MNHLPRLLLVPLLLLVPVLLSAGCGEESKSTRPADPVPVRIVISPPSGLLTGTGQILRLSATLYDATGNTLTGIGITWSSSNAAVASVSNIGVVVARSAGTAQITAAAGGLRTSITVTVARTPSRIVVTPVSLRLTEQGETLRLVAVVLDAGGAEITDAPRSWRSEHPMVASVDDQGVVTAHMKGETRITVSSGDLSASVPVTVAIDTPTNRVVVSPDSVNMTAIGETVQLSARVLDPNDQEIPSPDLTWTSEDEAVATVDAQGEVTAQMNGQTIVTVSWEELSASVMVTVAQAADRIEVSSRSVRLNEIGDMVTITARVLDAGGTEIQGAELAWTSENPSVASVDGQGVITARTEGETRITVSSGNLSASVTVTVDTETPTNRLVVSPESVNFTSIGETAQLSARVIDGNDMEISDPDLTWTSEDPAVASVDSQGEVTAQMNGQTIVTVTWEELAASVMVTVSQAADRIEVSSRSVRLSEIGDMVTITARVLDAGGTEFQGAELTWTSENPAVASVDGQGVITARTEGETRITVSSGDLSASVAVTVATVGRTNRIVVSPESVDMASIRETAQLSARVIDGNDMEISDPDLTWTSEDPAVASVDDQGEVTAQKNGQTLVTVSWEDLTASVSVTVEQRAYIVGAAPQTVYFDAAGETEALFGAVFDANGYEIPGAVLTWTSEDPAVATVDDQGVVTARMEGVTRVTATYGSLSDHVMVIVGTPTTLVVTTKSVRLTAIGETVYPDVKLLDAYGREIFGPGRALVWDSEDPAVATVDDSGGITAQMNGQTIVTVTSKDMSDSISVTVAQAAAHIVVTPGSVQLSAVGETVQLSAEVFDANDYKISGAEVTWSSDDPLVASVDDHGLVTAHKAGETELTVSSDSASTTVVVSVGEVSSDRSALVHFYHATDGPNWKNNTNWLTDEPLEEWHGISVSSAGHVVRIWLFDNDLDGNLPASLASLPHLKVLALSDSLLTGTIPAELGDLESLERIILTFSKISGSIPSSLSNLSKLKVLDLQYNQLTGGIPSSLGNLPNLAYLRLTGNPLGGSIPSSLGRLDKLQRLYLSGTGLTGSIPSSFGGLTSLIQLYMAGNSLTGSIPKELGTLERFISLRLTDNAGLTGPLPRTFLDLEMQALYLFGTNVCIPRDLEFEEWKFSFHTRYAMDCEAGPDLAALESMYNWMGGKNWAENTNWRSAKPFSEWFGVSVNSSGRVSRVELPGNKLTGGIQISLGGLAELRRLDLANNSLSGGIPAELGGLSKLLLLNLHNNEDMSGPLPAALTGMTSLGTLWLGGTGLCVPRTAAFQTWLDGIVTKEFEYCEAGN